MIVFIIICLITVAQDLMKYVQNVEGMLKTPDLDKKLVKSKFLNFLLIKMILNLLL